MQRRHTRQKQIIQSIIEGPGKHMTAEEVAAVLKETEPGIGMATVYRNLNQLCEEGMIQKLILNHVHVYDGNPNPHDHFVCIRCGRIIDLDCVDQKLIRKTEMDLDIRILRSFTVCEGICRKCGTEEEKQWN